MSDERGRDDWQDRLAQSEPVILLGRGGSGTRLLAQLALSVGVFLGNELNTTQDSVEWVGVLYELAIEAVTVGVERGSARDVYWRERLRRRAAEILAANHSDPTILWGWKLPETVLVVPEVLRTFPRARVVHLVRHPLTSSLRRTHMTSRLDNPVGRATLSAAYRAFHLDPSQIEHDEPYVHNAVTWAFQMRGVLDALRVAPPGKGYLQLRYEEVCADPAEARRALAAFLGVAAAHGAPPEIDHARAGTEPRVDARADRIWAICGAQATELGYER
jgi:hypothetical protein